MPLYFTQIRAFHTKLKPQTYLAYFLLLSVERDALLAYLFRTDRFYAGHGSRHKPPHQIWDYFRLIIEASREIDCLRHTSLAKLISPIQNSNDTRDGLTMLAYYARFIDRAGTKKEERREAIPLNLRIGGHRICRENRKVAINSR